MRTRGLMTGIVALLAVLGGLVLPALAPGATAFAEPTAGVSPSTQYGRLVLLLDSSGSMAEKAGDGRTKIADARTALDQVITRLPSQAYVGLRVFGATVFAKGQPGACTDTQSVVAPGTNNRAQLRTAVGRYKPYGETPIPAALKAAANDIGSEGKRSIVLVSDGESTCGNPCPVARAIGSSGVDVQIDVVGLDVTGKARKQLQCIAKSGHGTYYDAHNAGDLTNSIGRSAIRAAQPFTIEGTPVTGSTTSASAPTITAGSWLDKTPAEGGHRYYYIKRRIPGSTIFASIAVKPSGTDSASYSIQLLSPDKSDCGNSFGMKDFTFDTSRPVLASTHSQSEGGYAVCRTAGGLVLDLWNESTGTADPPALMQIFVTEEPRATNAASLPPEAGAGDQVWQALPQSGKVTDTSFGTSFSTAPELGDGTFRTSIVPGETQLYRVPLDWGQALEAEARVPAITPTKAAPYPGGILQIDILGPTLGGVDNTSAKDPGSADQSPLAMSGTAAVDSDDSADIRALSFPVRYNNLSADDGTAAASLAGDYYVMVSLDTGTPGGGEDGYIAPLDLAIKRVGTAGTGTPAFAKGGPTTTPPTAQATTPTPSANPTDSSGAATTTQAAAESPGQDDSHTTVLAVGLGGLGVVLLGTAAVLLLRRRVTRG